MAASKSWHGKSPPIDIGIQSYRRGPNSSENSSVPKPTRNPPDLDRFSPEVLEEVMHILKIRRSDQARNPPERGLKPAE